MEELTNAEIVERIEKIAKQHENITRHGYATSLPDRIASILRYYQDETSRALTSSQSFRDDVVLELRAMSLVVNMAGNAGTHAEKNARLRGMVDLLESAIRKLREMDFKFSSSYWRWDDVFASDMPIKQYIYQIRELEEEVRKLKGEPEKDKTPHKPEVDYPF